MLIDITPDEMNVLLKQINALEKALYKVKQCKRAMRMASKIDMEKNEAIIMGLKHKMEKARGEMLFPGEN